MIRIHSFGRKHGPLDVMGAVEIDVSVLKNPFFDLALRPLTGQHAQVQSYVMQGSAAQSLLDFAVSQAVRHKDKLTIAFKCVGGRHRSVAMAEMLKARLDELGITSQVTHRDI